ncbi:helix-turn-helix protein [Mucilaginibacter yixingensis]|uniref:Helix-turn-helix protein n=1 Tax=Mucilaginibacter yixingensis TaxID=1295612 RepID=A0A2T5J5V4_9SPHI|nr:helix-turn-helix domain-containing protein [Mucilaginibacter yixingensis]PTQ93646.1 helix-turn-helix protein [Mucilaginibacter yixingensis]
MAVEIITREDLEVFKKDLINEIKKLLGRERSTDSEWIRSNQVRKMLNISPNTLQNLRVAGSLKYTKVGGIFYYKKADIDSIMERGDR